jgi:hypothetical protein
VGEATWGAVRPPSVPPTCASANTVCWSSLYSRSISRSLSHLKWLSRTRTVVVESSSPVTALTSLIVSTMSLTIFSVESTSNQYSSARRPVPELFGSSSMWIPMSSPSSCATRVTSRSEQCVHLELHLLATLLPRGLALVPRVIGAAQVVLIIAVHRALHFPCDGNYSITLYRACTTGVRTTNV